MKKILIILLLAAILAIAAGCSQPSSEPTVQPPASPAKTKVITPVVTATSLPETTTQEPRAAASVSDNTITISKMTFSPAQITIRKGESVRWVNEDTRVQRIQLADTMKSPIISVGQSWTTPFNTAGTYDYFSMMDPSMQGTITVV